MKAATVLAALAAGAYATPISSMVSNEHDLFNEPLFDNKGAHAVQAHERYLAERLKHQHKRDLEEEAQNGAGHEEPAAVKKMDIGDDSRRPMITFTAVEPQTLGFPTHHERPTKQAMSSIPSFPTHHEKETLITFAAQPTEAVTNAVAPLAESTPAVTKVVMGPPQVPTAALPTHHDKQLLLPWPKVTSTTTTGTSTKSKSSSTQSASTKSTSTAKTTSTAKPSTSTTRRFRFNPRPITFVLTGTRTARATSTAKSSTSTTKRFRFRPRPTRLVLKTTNVPSGDAVILSSQAAESTTKPPATTTTKSATVTTTSSKMKITQAPRDVAYALNGGPDPRILASEANERSRLEAEASAFSSREAEASKTDKAALEPRHTSPVPSKWTAEPTAN